MNCLLLPHSLHIRLFVEVILKFEKRLIRKRNFHNKISKKEFKRIGEIEEIHILKQSCEMKKISRSHTGSRTRAAWVKARNPNR